jgi:predicted AlkP superfamily phosphohydrolase/phosphomutase
MDYELTAKLMSEGKLPNFSRAAEKGSFSPLTTSVPPQSPVAWSNFITGMDSGGHGIYDFVHRDPETMIPYLSTSRTHAGGRTIKIGKWQIPLSGGSVELLRRGQAFWEVLEENGIETTIIRMPANFPPSGSASRELSGMGTPDIIGTYGTFSFYTSELFAYAGQEISGGQVFEVDVFDGVVEAQLYGPDNPFLVEPQKVAAPFTAYLDAEESLAKIVVGDEEVILKVGEWSQWVPVDFELIPTQGLRGMVRFYLKQVEPDFELYVTPINFDPYTQGMPEDTAGLMEEVFTVDEFLTQTRIAGKEIVEQYEYVLDQFRNGLLFYYFGNVDQISHMMWRGRDPEHPAYDAERDARFAPLIDELYQELDGIVGYTLERMNDDDLLVVMSDHGFTSLRREFHLNAWLHKNGFLTVRDPNMEDDPGIFSNVDWTGTEAYGVGINGLYINLRGRERWGIVNPAEREAVMDEIAEKLLATIDPQTGEPAVTKVYKREGFYKDRGELEIGPDLIVGYAKRTRGSFASALGAVGQEVFSDNTRSWSGDHAMDHETVPGILLTNRPLKNEASRLEDLAAAILVELGIEDEFPSRSGEGADSGNGGH